MSMCWDCFGLLSIGKKMKVSNMIANMVAFDPPSQKSYSLESVEEEWDKRGGCYKKVEFHHSTYDGIAYPWLETECYQLQKCSTKRKIVLIYLRNKSNSLENKVTIIHSHGNSCDLGGTFSFLVDVSTQLKVDVISYDYSGYGRSEGSPSEEELYADIEQVMDFSLMSLHLKKENIVLLGTSLGSVPSVHIASKRLYSTLKGVILLSPIASGIKLVNPSLNMTDEELGKVDIFCNLNKASDISCPVFLIHGKQDDIIPYEQSYEMLQKIKSPYEWFPARGTHNNIPIKYRMKFYIKLKLFFEHLKYTKIKTQKTEWGLSDQNKLLSPYRLTEHMMLKPIKCEENYMMDSQSQNKQGSCGKEQYTVQSKQPSHRSNVVQCISIKKGNMIDLSHSSSENNPFSENNKSLYSNGRIATEENLNDANVKEIEYHFKEIEKKVKI